jgi:hypothetical protein
MAAQNAASPGGEHSWSPGFPFLTALCALVLSVAGALQLFFLIDAFAHNANMPVFAQSASVVAALLAAVASTVRRSQARTVLIGGAAGVWASAVFEPWFFALPDMATALHWLILAFIGVSIYAAHAERRLVHGGRRWVLLGGGAAIGLVTGLVLQVGALVIDLLLNPITF